MSLQYLRDQVNLTFVRYYAIVYTIMTGNHERGTNPVDGLVNAYYDQLVQQGRETAELQPAISLRGAAYGDVVRLDGDALHGHSVKTFTGSSVFPQDAENLARIGFTDEMQRDGIWLLRDVAYTHTDNGGWNRTEDPDSMTYAHWNGTDWHVTRVRRDGDRFGSDDWASHWQKPTTDLSDSEKDAIARIARETDFVLDAAASLQDEPLDYTAFQHALAKRAQDSGDERAVQDMNVLLRPFEHIPDGLVYHLYPTVYKLADLAAPLYRALAGKGQHNSSGLLAVQSLIASPLPVSESRQPMPIREAALCPPYEEIALA